MRPSNRIPRERMVFSPRQARLARQASQAGQVPCIAQADQRFKQRLGTGPRDEQLPFEPPEDWHEPTGRKHYEVLVQPAGDGFRHVVTPAEVRARLAQLPARFVQGLEVVQFSRMTRKKRSYPCYGMQWGACVYLYPMETDLTEYYSTPPDPRQVLEARQYGGRWIQAEPQEWRLVWTPETIRDFYLNNILIHEIGHLVDNHNSRSVDREKFAEWFALEYGYKPTRHLRHCHGKVRRRHARGRP